MFQDATRAGEIMGTIYNLTQGLDKCALVRRRNALKIRENKLALSLTISVDSVSFHLVWSIC